MIKNNIVIFKCNSLYQILSEIKSNLSFDIKNFIPDELDKKDLTNSIILSKLIYRDSLHQKKNINKNKIIFLLKKGEVLPITNKNQYILLTIVGRRVENEGAGNFTKNFSSAFKKKSYCCRFWENRFWSSCY